jgi:N-acetylneuraminic acid mutarotase
VSEDKTTSISVVGAPATRSVNTLLWTGTRVLTWGGGALSTTLPLENFVFDDGGLYDPSHDTWTTIAASPVSPPRSQCSAVWTGSEMLIWGGETGPKVNATGPNATDDFRAALSGAAYDPAQDRWRPMATHGQPSPRAANVAVWTGKEMIVWGGGLLPNPDLLSAAVADGAAYDPAADTWRPIRSAPEALVGAAAAWTGTEMLVWGGGSSTGYANRGYRYNPATDSWRAITTVGAPSARTPTGAVWTGTSFVVWGGIVSSSPPQSLSDGAVWFPDSPDGG